MKIPKVHAKKLKNLGKGLYECTDQRATLEKSFEGSSGGGGYLFYGYENPQQKIAKKNRKILRKGTRGAGAAKTSEPPTRTVASSEG
jgi:hypothetical protein